MLKFARTYFLASIGLAVMWMLMFSAVARMPRNVDDPSFGPIFGIITSVGSIFWFAGLIWLPVSVVVMALFMRSGLPIAAPLSYITFSYYSFCMWGPFGSFLPTWLQWEGTNYLLLLLFVISSYWSYRKLSKAEEPFAISSQKIFMLPRWIALPLLIVILYGATAIATLIVGLKAIKNFYHFQ